LASAAVAVVIVAVGCAADDGAGRDPRYAVAVVSFEPGEGAGFGMDRLPDVVLGPPRGTGAVRGSTDVLSLGRTGTITLELGSTVVDGEGPDFIVFENAFFVAGTRTVFADPGFVAVSEDGESFAELPCEAMGAPDYDGCAGVEPVYVDGHSEDGNGIDPFDPVEAGGDAFDLADFGVGRARFVRIRDSGEGPRMGGDNEGFDLDAIAVVHAQ
jgi:hypothetical protein